MRMDVLNVGKKLFEFIDKKMNNNVCSPLIKAFSACLDYFEPITDNAAVIFISLSIGFAMLIIMGWIGGYVLKRRLRINEKSFDKVPVSIGLFSFLYSFITAKVMDFLPYFHERLSTALSLTSSILLQSTVYLQEFADITGIDTNCIEKSMIVSYFYELPTNKWKELLQKNTEYNMLTEKLFDALSEIRNIPFTDIDITKSLYHQNIYAGIVCLVVFIVFHWYLSKQHERIFAKIAMVMIGICSALCSIYMSQVFIGEYAIIYILLLAFMKMVTKKQLR